MATQPEAQTETEQAAGARATTSVGRDGDRLIPGWVILSFFPVASMVPAEDWQGAGQSVYVTSAENGDVFDFTGGLDGGSGPNEAWARIGGPGARFAMGDALYGLTSRPPGGESLRPARAALDAGRRPRPAHLRRRRGRGLRHRTGGARPVALRPPQRRRVLAAHRQPGRRLRRRSRVRAVRADARARRHLPLEGRHGLGAGRRDVRGDPARVVHRPRHARRVALPAARRCGGSASAARAPASPAPGPTATASARPSTP